MADHKQQKKQLLVSLDEQAYERASAPSADEIREALKKGREDLRKASAKPRSVNIDPKRRFR